MATASGILFIVALIISYQVNVLAFTGSSKGSLSYCKISTPFRHDKSFNHASSLVMNAAIPIPSAAVVRSTVSTAVSVGKNVSKIVILVTSLVALLSTLVAKVRRKFDKAVLTSMEGGWTQRGYGGAFSRTVEVWTFALSWTYKYVSFTHMLTIYSIIALIILVIISKSDFLVTN